MKDELPSLLLVDLARTYGGAEVRVIETTRYFCQQCRCGVAVLSDSPLHRRLIKDGLPAYPLPFARKDPRLAREIGGLVNRHRFSIVDTQNPQSHLWGMLGARWGGAAALVATVHSSKDMTASAQKNFVHENVLRMCSFSGANFVAVSDSVAEYLINLRIPSARISTIRNGLSIPDAQTKREVLPETDNIRSQCGWSEHDFIIISVGRLEPVKGHQYLIAALPRIIEKHPEVKCLIVGTGSLDEILRRQVDTLGLTKAVHFAGFRSDIDELLQQSDAFCMPSLTEGLPYALFEACLHRLPVVCSDVGGMSRLLENLESAIKVQPKNVEAIIEAVDFLLSNRHRAAHMADAAHALVKKRYSADSTMAEMAELYRKLTLIQSGDTKS